MPQPRSTQRRLEAAAGGLATTAVQRMEDELPWYRALPAEDRSWVGMVAHAGIAAFIAWHADQDTLPPIAADVFGTAPRELTRSITLQQTLDLVRTTIDVVEQAVPEVAEPDERVEMRAAVSRWCSTRCCAPRPTRRCARGCRRWAGTRSRTLW